MGTFPVVGPPSYPLPGETAGESDSARKEDDSHLRSTRDVTGYHLQTAEETIGHVTDFMMDSKSRGNCHLVVETGSWYLRGMQLQPFPDSIAAFIASNSTKAASKS